MENGKKVNLKNQEEFLGKIVDSNKIYEYKNGDETFQYKRLKPNERLKLFAKYDIIELSNSIEEIQKKILAAQENNEEPCINIPVKLIDFVYEVVCYPDRLVGWSGVKDDNNNEVKFNSEKITEYDDFVVLTELAYAMLGLSNIDQDKKKENSIT